MQFNSIEFIFHFLPLFLAVYLIVPKALRNPVLIVGSLAFYYFSGGGNGWWVTLLIMLTLLTYVAGLTLTYHGAKVRLVICLTLMAAYLVFFKLFQGGYTCPRV